MKVTSLNEADRRPRRVAVGSFDGVHLGHRAVIGDADTVLTFNPHPLEVLAPERAPKLLTSYRRREELIAALGVEELIEIPFDRSFAKQSPQEFIDHVLDQGIGASEVRVGENFRFGAGATGDTALLGEQAAFETVVVPLLAVAALLEGEPVRILAMLIGAVIAFAVMGLIYLASRKSMGDGDVRLAPLLGAALGWLNPGLAPVGLFFGFLTGAVVGLVLMATGKAGRKTAVPFGPFLVLGSFLAIVWGQDYIDLILAR